VANTFLSGTEGRVIIDSATVAGLYNWSLQGQTSIIKIPHFESPTDALSRVWIEKLFGLSDGSGNLEGYFDIGTNPTDTIITNGIEVALALILFKNTVYGFGVTAVIGNFNVQTAVENQPQKWTATYEANGVVPLSAIIS
jgi:hypothetical protein